jgi:hypothetical protein
MLIKTAKSDYEESYEEKESKGVRTSGRMVRESHCNQVALSQHHRDMGRQIFREACSRQAEGTTSTLRPARGQCTPHRQAANGQTRECSRQ